MRRALLAALVLAAAPLGVPVAPAAPSSAAPAPVERAGHVLEQRVIGDSVRGREIRAWHLDDAKGKGPTVVLVSTMHGNEPATQQILHALRKGPQIRGVDLWVVPVYNPDGLAAHHRRNAHGVDLNRNYPYGWVDLDGNYESGSRPASEPETRAMMAFLKDVRPDYVLSFHQPLHGVDTDNKRPGFSRLVARTLRLPATRLDCGGVCHGTMTGWFNHTFPDAFALTVEYGARPPRTTMRVDAPRQVLRIFGAVARPTR
ncbi:murein peptide amidase A [Nocardioides anomalus]|uniref:Murein peptide amidase A n=1 Tax=Nocardioides anomalus TaxID=2712223 RepID=A0A6G6WG72_9ACTN|nr:M14 family zinc carboxypeptidase [Nocardioides anomalus]QIG44232.1 murein peptide amidase A [Nocardioides anomalus]